MLAPNPPMNRIDIPDRDALLQHLAALESDIARTRYDFALSAAAEAHIDVIRFRVQLLQAGLMRGTMT